MIGPLKNTILFRRDRDREWFLLRMVKGSERGVLSGCMNAALMMFIVIGGVGGLANAFVNNYALFCVCRFVAAMGQSL